MKRPRCLYSQLSEKVIRHQPEQAAVSANKKERRGCMGQEDVGGGQIKEWQADIRTCHTGECRWDSCQHWHLTDINSQHQPCVHVHFCLCLWYEMCVHVSMCTETESEGQMELYTHPHTLSVCDFLVSWLWNEYGRVRAEGSVTLGQGDRSGQVCVCERTPVCQRFVPGQQVASQRTSVTFSLSLPLPFSLCPSLPLSPSPNSSNLVASALAMHNKSWAHWGDEHAHKNTGVGGLFMNLCETLFWHGVAE